MFTVAATVTGAVTGFLIGALALPLPAVHAAWTGLILAGAGGADLALALRGWPRPPSVRRQVPQEWSRLFAPRTVALLYGARLGVGPLTILNTWVWWGALVAAALIGPATTALAGGLFGLTRTGVSLVASEWGRPAMPERMGALRRRERHAALATGVALLGLAALTLTAALPLSNP